MVDQLVNVLWAWVGLAVPLDAGVPVADRVELSVFVLIGVLGGAHCLGMCGPLVTMYADRFGDGGRSTRVTTRELRQHLLFNLGRAGSYAVLGGLFGLAGALVYDSLAVVLTIGDTVRATVGIAVGVGIVATGLRYVLGGTVGHGAAGRQVPGVGKLTAVFGTVQSRLDGLASGPGILALGAVHGLLPCPLLYPAYLYAFARGSPVLGVQALALLGLGTIPTLFAYGTVVQSVGAGTRERLHRALGVAFVLLGLLPIVHALALFGLPVPHVKLPVYQPLS